MKVLILGTGYVGSSIARAFVAKGHQVTGVTRTAEKSTTLLQNEIIPLIAKAQEIATWEKQAEESDVIIEALADAQDPKTAGVVCKALVAILEKNKNKIVLYTSGVWTYGDTGRETVTEIAALHPPPKAAARPDIEKAYLAAGAVVMRSGCVFGRQGGLTGIWFRAIAEGTVSLSGSGEHYWSMIHVDDLADAYLRAAERPSVSRGQIYNVIGSFETVQTCVKAIAEEANFQGPIKFYGKATDPLNECLQMSQKASSQKAFVQLGWHANHTSFTHGVSTYYKSWLAYKK